MRIRKIELYNIGPYEGLNTFDIFNQNKNGKINIIGGKNGAGKTTLFTAIKLCLYGYKESGYQSANAYYKKKISKLINETIKLNHSAKANVRLTLEIFNGQEWDIYILSREWNLDADNFESFNVQKNNDTLSNEEVYDFENYILNLIPPELFNMYFFDGEQIADFFLDSKGNENIKSAFMTICGYDTFELISKNFKRLEKKLDFDNTYLDEYFKASDDLYNATVAFKKCDESVKQIYAEIDQLDSEISKLGQEYTASGGTTLDEWNQLFLNIKAEERLREDKNAWIKTAANDKIPYIILKDNIAALMDQIYLEKDLERQDVLFEVIDSLIPKLFNEISEEVPQFDDNLRATIYKRIEAEIKNKRLPGHTILCLSKHESELLLRQSMQLLSYEKDQIINERNEIKKSLERSQINRDQIEKSNIDEIDTFLKTKENLIENKRISVTKLETLLHEKKELQLKLDQANSIYTNAEKKLEKQLKNNSITNLTVKSIRFLDVLQKRLFKVEKEKVESLFVAKINQLIRKDNFISKLIIGEDFSLHVFKQVTQRYNVICNNILKLSPEGYYKKYGEVHCDNLLNAHDCNDLKEFSERYISSNDNVETLLEFDKSTMSKGEKQVFIMALYWAIMELCNKDVPFIIDTPFARIDTIHRSHITEFFFKELRGQIFIFSTDEEITDEHLKIIGDDLQSSFLIENNNNIRTTITEKAYFGDK